MKISLDWKAGILPAVRTAGALMVGNAGVTYFLGTVKTTTALLLLVVGAIIIVLGSFTFKEK